MNWLILETSSRVARVGLARDGVLVLATHLDDARRHARDLAATIDSFLKAEALVPRDVTGVMVSQGPGSYTGLRVGLMSAKAFAYATGCQLIAVDTFSAIAEQAHAKIHDQWIIADALQGQVYRQRFTRSGTQWQAADGLRIDRVEDWLALVTPGVWISGPGVLAYADRIPKECPLVPEPDIAARITSVFVVGATRVPVTRAELFSLEPLYLRGSSAEEKAKLS